MVMGTWVSHYSRGGMVRWIALRGRRLQALEGSQAQRQSLRPTSYPHKTGDRPVIALLLDAQVRQSVLT